MSYFIECLFLILVLFFFITRVLTLASLKEVQGTLVSTENENKYIRAYYQFTWEGVVYNSFEVFPSEVKEIIPSTNTLLIKVPPSKRGYCTNYSGGRVILCMASAAASGFVLAAYIYIQFL